jgi:leucyl aminopeptidase
MDFSIKSGHVEKQRVACLVIGVYEPRRLTDTGLLVDHFSQQYLSSILRCGDIEGKLGQTLLLHQVPNILAQRVLLIGCGRERELTLQHYRKILHKMVSVLNQAHISDVACYLPEINVKNKSLYWRISDAICTINDALYQFEALKTIKKKKAPSLKRMSFFVNSRRELDKTDSILAQSYAISAGIKLAKDLGNTPPNICTPSYLAKHAKRMEYDFNQNLRCTVLETEDMEKLNMGGVLAVAKGSNEAPKFIVLDYKGTDESVAPIALVGKGVTFDSGGISLKPAAKMDEMKYDMSGAAAVLGTMQAVAELSLPLNIMAVIPAVENLPSGHATRPGDIIVTASGQTVEVLNTDAEGRLILADALHYCQQFNPSTVIDVATLTGACIVALGRELAAVIGNHSVLVNNLLRAGEACGDRVWELPLLDEYQDLMKSPFADMANISNDNAAGAGTITGACFLSRFTEKMDWAHLDIAGVAWRSGAKKGATGRPVRLLIQYLFNIIQQPA